MQDLLGPDYVLLRDEFIDFAPNVKIRSGSLSRLLVFFGGTDSTNETMKTLRAISDCDKNWHIDVIVGSSNPNIEEIKFMCERYGYFLHIQVSTMARFMHEADFAIGAGRSTTWERCFMALPSLTIIVADNQKEITEAVAEYGATVLLGESSSVSSDDIKDALLTLANDQERVRTISLKSSQLVKRDVVASYPLPRALME
ncbi:PseG/SpsG family protein [Alkalihalobacterium alkalinitrilicum]|uniref:PseG/SpsG family protein n=1 Tax=Alkalihalobacterium alkalinitrilicum TaxID=427920 RepID=UPI00130379F7|nr:glycosyltransferase [Alkalihalobacterium alkalinitrilicum]